MQKNIAIIATSIVAVLLVVFLGLVSFHHNKKDQEVLILQFGKVVDVKEDPGVYLTIPFVQSTKEIFVGERLYDLPSTEVITADKKTMISNCYVIWRIDDAQKYNQTLSSEAVAQSRINTATYNAMKNYISSTNQEDVIGGKDGSLGSNILKKITSLSQYGIEITQMEIKVLDLPNDNKEAVYSRMISERNAIAAEYKAEGDKEANTIKTQADADVKKIVSDAEVKAADVIADGEKQYYSILADSYGKSAERREFYNFMIELEAMKESLKNGGTVVIDENSPLYDILNNTAG